jgi:hypothetical protein
MDVAKSIFVGMLSQLLCVVVILIGIAVFVLYKRGVLFKKSGKISDKSGASVQPSKSCEACGASNPIENNFCDKCGAKFSE